MSWYVEQILLSGENEDNEDFRSDKLSIEMMVERLKNKNLISNRDFIVLNLVDTGHSFSYISKVLEMDRRTVKTIFKSTCQKLAFFLGDYFTDQGYIDYLSNKYHLLDDEIEKIYTILEEYKRGYE